MDESPGRPGAASRAEVAAPLLDAIFVGPAPVGFRFWDGSRLGAPDSSGEVVVRSSDTLRRLLWAPGELGLARAFVAGDLQVDGDLLETLKALTEAGRRNRRPGFRTWRLGFDHQVEIRLQDYRDVRGERSDAISSIGMSEHVGSVQIAGYFRALNRLLTDGGRQLNHAISPKQMGPATYPLPNYLGLRVGSSKTGRASRLGATIV